MVLVFHMKDEVFQEILLLENLALEDFMNIQSLGVNKYETLVDLNTTCCVWVMKDYGVYQVLD